MGARFSSRRPGRAAPAPAPARGDLVASMQRSASSVGDAFTEAVASASRSVGAFGLEREIASYESKIRARKRQFGVEAYGPLRAADCQALALVFNAARNDISALQAVIDRKRAALAPQGFSRFYRDYGDTFYSALAVFARPADFDDFLAEGARGIV